MPITNARFYFACFLAARFARGFTRVLLRRLNHHHSTNPNPCRRTHLLQRAQKPNMISKTKPLKSPLRRVPTNSANHQTRPALDDEVSAGKF
jgi:hypothetical protein